ncbi:MAG TPA: response regulator transcription factor [Propionibacteriaceae bacterium]|nr:response regulator transcription factor [Propionibacteriaceae bacterium]
MSRILLVDDDPTLRRTLQLNLAARGHEVTLASSGAEALQAVRDGDPELIVLDLGLPDLDGIEVLLQVRGELTAPVIVLSARREAHDKVLALDIGAIDYVTKPFSMDELMARVRAALRRRPSPEDDAVPTVSGSGLVLDFANHRATRGDEVVHLTPTEWRVLAELARNLGRVVSHENLLRAAWGPTYGRERHYLRVFANQIRRKIEVDPARPVHLVNEPGLGYRLVV